MKSEKASWRRLFELCVFDVCLLSWLKDRSQERESQSEATSVMFPVEKAWVICETEEKKEFSLERSMDCGVHMLQSEAGQAKGPKGIVNGPLRAIEVIEKFETGK